MIVLRALFAIGAVQIIYTGAVVQLTGAAVLAAFNPEHGAVGDAVRHASAGRLLGHDCMDGAALGLAGEVVEPRVE